MKNLNFEKIFLFSPKNSYQCCLLCRCLLSGRLCPLSSFFVFPFPMLSVSHFTENIYIFLRCSHEQIFSLSGLPKRMGKLCFDERVFLQSLYQVQLSWYFNVKSKFLIPNVFMSLNLMK